MIRRSGSKYYHKRFRSNGEPYYLAYAVIKGKMKGVGTFKTIKEAEIAVDTYHYIEDQRNYPKLRHQEIFSPPELLKCENCSTNLTISNFQSHEMSRSGKILCTSCPETPAKYKKRSKKGTFSHKFESMITLQLAEKTLARRNIAPSTITVNDLLQLLEKQEFKCALSGVLLSPTTGRKNTVSIDRIDGNLGYTIDNIQLVMSEINIMKGAMEESDFINLCYKVVDSKPKPLTDIDLSQRCSHTIKKRK